MPQSRRVTHVFGPAYLDRVVHVDRPLHEAGQSPLDQSVDGIWKFGEGLTLRDPEGFAIAIALPAEWPGPQGTVELSRRLGGDRSTRVIDAVGLSWHDDLGGMGAGYASALDGVLVSALGSKQDPMSIAVERRIQDLGLRHHPIRVAEHSADWTLLVTSGRHGDKLPVGFRGCHAAILTLEDFGTCDLRVVASFPNRLAAQALRLDGAKLRVFAPAMRNMIDRESSVERFAEFVDLLCCNRHEWESLEGREQVAWQVSVLAVTDGANGCVLRFTTPEGEAGRLELPAFPRANPPRDTNRAGEAFASTLVQTLMDEGWEPSHGTTASLIERAGLRASAAAGLVLDRVDFGFPTGRQIDMAVNAGMIQSSGDGS